MNANHFTETLKDGEPCNHPGCLNHVTHPCEGCGRIKGKSVDYFTTVLLPMHIKLQWLYLKKCGDWQVGDKVYCREYDSATGIVISITGTRILVNFTFTDRSRINVPFDKYANNLPLLIPRTIDESSPEAQKRSIVEMLNGNKVLAYLGHNWMLFNNDKQFFGTTPTEAILRALLAQEGGRNNE